MYQYLIHYIILSVYALTEVQSRIHFELEDTESPDSNVYVANEDEDITPLLSQNYENIGLAENGYDNPELQHAFLQKQIPMQFDDSYRVPPMYRHYNKFIGNRYVNPNYEIYKYVPNTYASDNMNAYASTMHQTQQTHQTHRPFVPFRSTMQSPTNHPLYANLFWRKIVYPDSFPTNYEKESSNRHSYIEDIDSFKRRSLRNKLRERNYKRYMNQLKTLNSINNKKVSGFRPIYPVPISQSSVLNHRLSSPSNKSSIYYPKSSLSSNSSSKRRKQKSPAITSIKQTYKQNQSKSSNSSAKKS